jgi:kynurenine formamidase
LIDISHTIEHGMLTYKGLPGPVISDHLSREASRAAYARGTEFHIGKDGATDPSYETNGASALVRR